MSPRKLSDADKKDILSLYQRLEETTSTLATRYDVSNSTISRILKSSLLESDYEALIQQKRSNRTSSSQTPIVESRSSVEPDLASASEIQQPDSPVEADSDSAISTAALQRWRRRRSSVAPEPVTKPNVIQTELKLDIKAPTSELLSEELSEVLTEIKSPKPSHHLEDLLDEDLMDLDEDDDDEGHDDEDDDDDDWDDYESAEAGTQGPIKTSRVASGASVQVLPLSEAALPRTCYVVVDRAAELIARPLKEFGDLGRIPIEETQEKTLPVFDNHRVARRFSNRSQRVIKVPDGRMLQKTCSHLQAKGITRLLIDGQVYSLMPQPPI